MSLRHRIAQRQPTAKTSKCGLCNFWARCLSASISLREREPIKALNGSEVWSEGEERKNTLRTMRTWASRVCVIMCLKIVISPSTADDDYFAVASFVETSRILRLLMNHVVESLTRLLSRRKSSRVHCCAKSAMICQRRKVVAPAWLSGLIRVNALSHLIAVHRRAFSLPTKE